MATLSYLSYPHFPGNRLWRFPGKWVRVEGGGLVAATCIPDRDKENVQLSRSKDRSEGGPPVGFHFSISLTYVREVFTGNEPTASALSLT